LCDGLGMIIYRQGYKDLAVAMAKGIGIPDN
jgi:hypothetical protein